MEEIKIQFDETIGAFVVTLPAFTTLGALNRWEPLFLQAMAVQPGRVGLLFDTSSHNFESIECLKWLRQFFTDRAGIGSKINRVAFVQPAKYKLPQMTSETEAYFLSVQEAYSWLQHARWSGSDAPF